MFKKTGAGKTVNLEIKKGKLLAVGET